MTFFSFVFSFFFFPQVSNFLLYLYVNLETEEEIHTKYLPEVTLHGDLCRYRADWTGPIPTT